MYIKEHSPDEIEHSNPGTHIRRSFQKELEAVKADQAQKVSHITRMAVQHQSQRPSAQPTMQEVYTFVDKNGKEEIVTDDQIRKLDEELTRDQEAHGHNFFHSPLWASTSPAANLQWKLFCKKEQGRALTTQVMNLAQCDTCTIRLDSLIMRGLRNMLAKREKLSSEQLTLYSLIKEFRAVIYLATEVDLPWHIWDEVRLSVCRIRNHRWHRSCSFTCHQVMKLRRAQNGRTAHRLVNVLT